MTLPTILALAGCIALLAGLFGGGITVKDLSIPKIANSARFFSTIFGVVLIGLSVSMSLSPALTSSSTSGEAAFSWKAGFPLSSRKSFGVWKERAIPAFSRRFSEDQRLK